MEENKKIEEFVTKYGELVKEYNVDFANYPMFVPNEDGSFKVIVQTTPVDVSKFNKKEEFIK